MNCIFMEKCSSAVPKSSGVCSSAILCTLRQKTHPELKKSIILLSLTRLSDAELELQRLNEVKSGWARLSL